MIRLDKLTQKCQEALQKAVELASELGHQQIALDLLFACSAQALQDLALNPRLLGARLGMLGVLHTSRATPFSI